MARGTIVVTVFRIGLRSIVVIRLLEHERLLKKPEPSGKQLCEFTRERFLRQALRSFQNPKKHSLQSARVRQQDLHGRELRDGRDTGLDGRRIRFLEAAQRQHITLVYAMRCQMLGE